MRLIKDPLVQKVIEAFESTEATTANQPPIPLRQVSVDKPLSQIITVDGSSLDVPQLQRAERQMGFVQIAARLFKIDTLEKLEREPLLTTALAMLVEPPCSGTP